MGKFVKILAIFLSGILLFGSPSFAATPSSSLTFRMSRTYNFDFLFFETQALETSHFHVIFSKIKAINLFSPLFLLGKRAAVSQKIASVF